MTEGSNPREPAFCAVVDLDYLPRALAMYRSLERTCPGFTLHVVCMDAHVRRLVELLELRQAVAYDVDGLERNDPELRALKPSRSSVEYCWTVKPVLCRYLLEQLGLDAVTYIDSDLLFFGDPRIVFAELGHGSIMILPHRFPSRWAEWEASDGIFNGAWLTFRRDNLALEALGWWRERCLEWCYDRRKDGKYADQHYLDDWPARFEGVRVIANPGAGLAPWNACRYRLARRDGARFVDGRPAVFYHYQSLRIVRAPPRLRSLGLELSGYRLMRDPPRFLWWTAPEYEMSDQEVEIFWEPYLRVLAQAFAELRLVEPGFSHGTTSMRPDELALALARRTLPQAVRRRLRAIFAPGGSR